MCLWATLGTSTTNLASLSPWTLYYWEHIYCLSPESCVLLLSQPGPLSVICEDGGV